jgi:hypothetical protein
MPVGCGIHSRDLTNWQQELSALPLLELEDYLDPDFAEHDHEALPLIQQQLEQYRGSLMLSGPYIDLNPGSPERLIIEATRQHFN